MVVDVVSDISFVIEEFGFFFGFENFGIGEEIIGGDIIFDESGVVGVVGEERGNMSFVVGFVEFFEISFKDVGIRWVGEVEGVFIIIVNIVDVVGRGNFGVLVFGMKWRD